MKVTVDFASGAWPRLVLSCLIVLCTHLLAGISAVAAHEVRPAYLELKEVMPGNFEVLFKTPMRGDSRLALAVSFSGPTQQATPIVSQMTEGAMLQTWRLKATEPLPGQEVRIDGLASTMTDALVRIEFIDGRSWLERLTPASPRAVIPAVQSGWTVAATYLKLGIEHILLGIDHLLFVLALMLLVQNTRQLVKTITACTVAHSITLASATLGLVTVPSRPIEALIALSIAFVALEIVHAREGRIGIAVRAPWIVAFAFGLLHGLGFAGALSEIGLPAGHIPVALFFFNVGVEIGQLLFVAAILGLVALIRATRLVLPRWANLVPPYLIGSVAMFWVIQRLASF
jgi:hydrogenase/urease accessory protein HupE